MLQGRAPVDVTAMTERDPGADNVFIIPSDALQSLVNDPAIGDVLFGADPQAVQATIDSMKYIDYYISDRSPRPTS